MGISWVEIEIIESKSKIAMKMFLVVETERSVKLGSVDRVWIGIGACYTIMAFSLRLWKWR